ncbi:MAG: PPC domain-containing protein, partial [Pirellulaceae bacterium]
MRRPNVEALEERRLMAAVPYSDGLYYPLAGKNAAFLPGNISYQEYVRRANLTNGLSGGGGSSGGNSFSEPDGLAPVIAFNTMEIEPNDFLSNAQLLPLGTVPGKSQTVTVAGVMSQVVTIFDEDYYAVDLRAGDIFDARVTGGLTTSFDLSLNDASNRTLIASRLPFPVGTPIYPDNSPLSTDGAVNLSYVIPASGRYYVRVSDGLGPYNLRLQAFRNTIEQQGVGTKQIVFVDFDGATIRGDIYG